MTLRLPAGLLDEVLAHCRVEHPREACGIVAGHGDQLTFVRRMHNVHVDPHTRFAFDPDDQLDLYRGLDELGLEPVVIYHSHTASAPVPSRTDVAAARETQAHYVIVSTHTDEVRSYRLEGEELVEETVEVMVACG